jgi:hypothetical protein
MVDATTGNEARDDKEEVTKAMPSLPIFSACVSSSKSAAARKQRHLRWFNNALTSTSETEEDGVIAAACSEKLVGEEFSSLSSKENSGTKRMMYCDYNGCPPVSSRLIQNCTR